jgi:hypothetical protein
MLLSVDWTALLDVFLAGKQAGFQLRILKQTV